MSDVIGKANLEVFAETLLNEAKKNSNIIAVTSDSRGSGKLINYGQELPDQIVEVGIAEQNLIGVASGLSREGYKVFVTSFAPFLSMRASEHVRMNLGYMKHNVN